MDYNKIQLYFIHATKEELLTDIIEYEIDAINYKNFIDAITKFVSRYQNVVKNL